jgi:hypothetical protein
MKILIIGGSHDGARPEVAEDPHVLFHDGEALQRHEIVITNHDDRREVFVLYTPPDMSLGDIFRKVLSGYLIERR